MVDAIKLKGLKSNVERHMLRFYNAELCQDSGHPNFEGGWLDHNPMIHGVATAMFASPINFYPPRVRSIETRFIINMNKTSGKFTIYKHIDTINGEHL